MGGDVDFSGLLESGEGDLEMRGMRASLRIGKGLLHMNWSRLGMRIVICAPKDRFGVRVQIGGRRRMMDQPLRGGRGESDCWGWSE